MENVVQALFIAFAILVFVIAISISFTSLSQVKQTADVVLRYSDRDYYQEYANVNKNEYQNGGRTVGVDTVITTLLRAKRENYAVKIIKNGTVEVFDYNYGIDNEDSKINSFIQDNINSNDKYVETYIETTISGRTYVGEDGTTIEENVGKKGYITYECK